MSEALAHTSVMLEETLASLAPKSGGWFADATLGAGGHAEAILEASAPDGRLLGVDKDPVALGMAQARLARFGARVTLDQASFADLPKVMQRHGVRYIDGLVADLGVSSMQLEVAERGFSFRFEGPLDMRMDTTAGETARELIERLSEEALADVIYRYGEERRSRAVASSIHRALQEGQLETTEDLRRAVGRVIKRGGSRIDPATRTFQALRIAVNREIEDLERLIRQLPDLLADDGVAAIISFHSLEDRVVKHSFRNDERLVPLTKRPLVPSDEERQRNPRARSAKLRAAKRVPREVVA